MWSIVKTTKQDIDSWLRLAKSVQHEFHDLDISDNSQFCTVLEKNIDRGSAIAAKDIRTGELLGGLLYSTKANQIGWLAVSPSHRRRGIGRQLVQHMYQQLDPVRPIKVNTFHESDQAGPAAHQFYRRLGFVVISTEQNERVNSGLPYQVLERPPA